MEQCIMSIPKEQTVQNAYYEKKAVMSKMDPDHNIKKIVYTKHPCHSQTTHQFV